MFIRPCYRTKNGKRHAYWALMEKEALEAFLKHRLGDLFGLEYDLLLYDVTSTYFEGQSA